MKYLKMSFESKCKILPHKKQKEAFRLGEKLLLYLILFNDDNNESTAPPRGEELLIPSLLRGAVGSKRILRGSASRSA